MSSSSNDILKGRVDPTTGKFVCEEPSSKTPGALCLSVMKNEEHNKRSHRSKLHAAAGSRHATLAKEIKIKCLHCSGTYSSPHNLIAHYRQNPKTHGFCTKQDNIFAQYPELKHLVAAAKDDEDDDDGEDQ